MPITFIFSTKIFLRCKSLSKQIERQMSRYWSILYNLQNINAGETTKANFTAQKMKFFIKDFLSKYDQIRR